MHGQGLPPGFINTLVLVQYLIFLSDPALAIRQQYLNGVLPKDVLPLLTLRSRGEVLKTQGKICGDFQNTRKELPE
jgi:hypothetical protein